MGWDAVAEFCLPVWISFHPGECLQKLIFQSELMNVVLLCPFILCTEVNYLHTSSYPRTVSTDKAICNSVFFFPDSALMLHVEYKVSKQALTLPRINTTTKQNSCELLSR